MKLAWSLLWFSVSATPVEEVVTLLKKLHTQIEADGEKEQKMYDKFACWCETTSSRKAGAITDAKEELRKLGQKILSLGGEVAEHAAKIDGLLTDIKDNQKEQTEATEIRSKENQVYAAETSEMKQAMAAITKAITVLGGQDFFLQANAIHDAIQALPTRTTTPASPKQMSMLHEFAGSTSQHQASYSPQSTTIKKILSQMHDTLGTDLEKATTTEESKNGDFEDLIATKQEEATVMRKTLVKKEREKHEAEVALSEATQTYDDTEQQMKADISFFDDAKEMCSKNNKLWTDRKELRESELNGIKKAIEILTSDEAREQFGKAFSSAAAFVQTESDVMSPAIQHAYQSIKAQASKAHSLRLAKLAVKVKSSKKGQFAEVIKAIDDLIQNLKDEEADDIKKRDECKDKYQEIESTVKDLEWKIEKNEAKINKLEKAIKDKTKEREETINMIKDTLEEIKQMEDTRKEENELFLEAKKDDEEAIKLLEKAKDALAEYYKKNALLQEDPDFKVSEDQAPEFELSDKMKRKNESSGIVGLMKMLIEGLETEIKNGQKDEDEAQLEFEKNLGAAKKVVKELTEKKTNLKKQIADRNEDKTNEEDDKKANGQDLTDENDYKADIKPDCDWIMENFDKRDKHREAEMKGLTEAKEYLAGAKPSGFLQRVGPHSLHQ